MLTQPHRPRLPALARRCGALLGMVMLAGCAGLSLEDRSAAKPTAPAMPERWQAALPHAGRAAELERWWRQFDDPVLVGLIESGQAANASLSQAAARIAQAREALTRASALAAPLVDLAGTRQRGPISFGGAPFVRTQDTLLAQASWEIDLFGALAAERRAGAARVAAGEASWHDARVAVAAELASHYLNLRACEARLALAQRDLDSRQITEAMLQQSLAAGLSASADLALVQSAVAEQRSRVLAQAAECDKMIKSLVALTAIDEPDLRARLRAGATRLPAPAAFQVNLLPAQLLEQRPDLRAAALQLGAAQAELEMMLARRLPRIGLSGAIGPLRFDAAGIQLSATNWSLSPTITLPLHDGGQRRAAIDSAQARLLAAQEAYRALARTAVQETEVALVRLDAAERQQVQARQAAASLLQSLQAVETRHRAGLANRLQLEESRRLALQAEQQLLSLAQERVLAWIALYRALGGGWTPG